MWWKRWLLGIAVVLVGVYAAAIFLAHRTPPLSISQGTSNVGENAYLIGVDLDNTGLFPVTLLRARVEPVREARITAVVSLEDPGGNSICQASSAALYPDGCPHQRTGEVAGWRIPPARPRGELHGLRVELPLEAGPEEQILVVSYRYLGWTFTDERPIRPRP